MPIRKEHRRAGGAEERAWRRRTSRVLRSGISAATETGIAPDPRLDHKHSRQAPEQLVTRRAAACFQLRRLIAALFVCEGLRRRRAASQLPAVKHAAKISNVMILYGIRRGSSCWLTVLTVGELNKVMRGLQARARPSGSQPTQKPGTIAFTERIPRRISWASYDRFLPKLSWPLRRDSGG